MSCYLARHNLVTINHPICASNTSTVKLQNFVMDVSKKGRVHNNDASVISLCEICINDYLHFLRISQNISRTFHPNPYLCIWLHLTCLHHHHIITSSHHLISTILIAE